MKEQIIAFVAVAAVIIVPLVSIGLAIFFIIEFRRFKREDKRNPFDERDPFA